MLRIVKAAVTLVALVGVYQVAAGANGVSVPPSPSPSGAIGHAARDDARGDGGRSL